MTLHVDWRLPRRCSCGWRLCVDAISATVFNDYARGLRIPNAVTTELCHG